MSVNTYKTHLHDIEIVEVEVLENSTKYDYNQSVCNYHYELGVIYLFV